MAKYTTTIMEIIQSELINNGFNEFVNNGKLTFDNQEFAFIQKVLRFDEDVKNIVDKTIFKGFNFKDEKIDNHFKKAFVTRFLDREIGRQTVESFASLVLYETIIREEYIHTVFGSEVYKYLENHIDYKGEVIGNTIEDEIQNQINEETQNQNSEENQNETQNQNNSSNTESNSQNVSSDRESTSSLPQSEMNMNVDNDVLTFADSNTISKNKTTNDSDENTTSQTDSTSETMTTGNQDLTRETITTGSQDTTTNGKQDSSRNSNQDTSSNQKSLTKTYLLENLDKIYSMRERLFNDYDKKCFLHIW